MSINVLIYVCSQQGDIRTPTSAPLPPPPKEIKQIHTQKTKTSYIISKL